MVAKRKRKAPAEQSADVDYKGLYDDLRQQVKEANAAKKKLLTIIANDIDKLFQKICDPDPPGCGGSNRPKVTFKALCLSVQAANANKKKLLGTLYDDVQNLFQKICDPDPPGC